MSLVATSRDVLEHYEHTASVMERPPNAQIVKWDDKEVNKKKEFRETEKRALLEKLNADKTKTNRSSWSITKALSGRAIKAYNFVMDKEDDEAQWGEEDDDYDNTANNAEAPVDFEVPILNLELAVACCEAIMKNILSIQVVQDVEELREWCRSYKDLVYVSKLPDEQLAFLVEALVEQKRVEVHDELLVLLPSSTVDSSQRDTAVALFQIASAQKRTELNLARWNAQHAATTRRAQQLKQQGRTQQALTELRKRTLLEEHMDTAHASLLNLEQTKTAIENAANQRQILQALSSTTEALQETRLNVDDVDTVALDLQDELELLSKAVHSPTAAEEDELLQELEELTANDPEPQPEPTVEEETKPETLKATTEPKAVEKKLRAVALF